MGKLPKETTREQAIAWESGSIKNKGQRKAVSISAEPLNLGGTCVVGERRREIVNGMVE